MMFDFHRHDEFSSFDGFGRAIDLAHLAAGRGFPALGLTNHGNVNGLIRHYTACKEAEIKPVMGVEAYFQPALNKDKKRGHLCLAIKNLKGFENLNRLNYIANEQMYYKPLLSFKDLEQHSDGLICSSACIVGPLSQAVIDRNKKLAEKLIFKFKDIFGPDFYIEIMPYRIDKIGTQESVNEKLISLANNAGVKCILTSDSHYGRKEDFPTYLKMHEIAKHTQYDLTETYGERYMPDLLDLPKRCFKMHGNKKQALEFWDNTGEILSKIDDDMLDNMHMQYPAMHKTPELSHNILVQTVVKAAKEKGLYNGIYRSRIVDEAAIIGEHGFADYFLVVADYVNWSKQQGIKVGPGRGSVCNSLIAYLLGITDVDSVKFNLDFRRFLRLDKKALPDIDLDFETDRRQEVIDYITTKYQGNSAQICSFGLYRVDNLINDLVKVCGEPPVEVIKQVKKRLKGCMDESGNLIIEDVKKDRDLLAYNIKYDGIIGHFCKLYKQVRFIGTHAAGVAIAGDDLFKYAPLKQDRKSGKIFTAFDLLDLEQIGAIKLDILGLNTMEAQRELESLTGVEVGYKVLTDPKLYKAFREGHTEGVFQLESNTAKDILSGIDADCFDDIVAASSMNRPGPLSLQMPQQYAENKMAYKLGTMDTDTPYFEYVKETYGTIVYQEQLQAICVNIGGLSWAEADKVLKMMKGSVFEGEKRQREAGELTAKFIKGASKHGYGKAEAEELFKSMLVYAFNKGHATGYSLISMADMFYKIYYPVEFWYVKIKGARTDADRFKYVMQAVKQGIVVFIPHVNYSADYSLRTFEGEKVIQEGLCNYKGLGLKTVQKIEDERKENGLYKSVQDFKDRTKKLGGIGPKLVEMLIEHGALEFNKKVYLNRVIKYNSSILGRS